MAAAVMIQLTHLGRRTSLGQGRLAAGGGSARSMPARPSAPRLSQGASRTGIIDAHRRRLCRCRRADEATPGLDGIELRMPTATFSMDQFMVAGPDERSRPAAMAVQFRRSHAVSRCEVLAGHTASRVGARISLSVCAFPPKKPASGRHRRGAEGHGHSPHRLKAIRTSCDFRQHHPRVASTYRRGSWPM